MKHDEFKFSKEQYEGRPTLDLIRELVRLNREWKGILNGQRGVDYWGGLDDAIANEKTSVEFEICRRALIEFDKEALPSVMMEQGVTPVSSQYYAYILHGIIASALSELDNAKPGSAREILQSAAVNYSETK